MVLDASLLNTQHYKVRIKGKVEQSREGVAPPLHLGVVAIEKGAFGLPSTMVANFTFTYIGCLYINGFLGCLNIHGYIGCLNIHGTHMTANNSTDNNVVFFFVSDLEIVYYKWTRVQTLDETDCIFT